MSAGNGGALVKSPPSIYSHQNVGWGGHNTSLQNSQPQIHPLRATVTKVSSGDSGKTSKYEFNTIEKKVQSQELEQSCNCGGWSKAKQLGHDLIQLRGHHESILRGLFQEVEDLKQKNRDLTFTLLMGPNPKQFNIEAPSYSESSRITAKIKQERSTSISENDINTMKYLTINNKAIGNLTNNKNMTADDVSKSYEKVQLDPIRTRCSTMEFLEDEMKEGRRKLQEEKRKNEYLWRVVEELKRQVAEYKNVKKGENNRLNFKNSSLGTQFDVGRSNTNWHGTPNKPVRPLYLPAIVNKTDKEEKGRTITMASSFNKFQSDSYNALNSPTFTKSCPTLPSINSTNEGVTNWRDRHNKTENYTDYLLLNNKHSTCKDEQRNKHKSLPAKGKNWNKKGIVEQDRSYSEQSLTENLDSSTEDVRLMQNNERGKGLMGSVPSIENSKEQVFLVCEELNVAPNKDNPQIVECVTLGNTINIIDMPNETSSSKELSSARPKVKSKGRRSGRNKRRKNVMQNNDAEIVGE